MIMGKKKKQPRKKRKSKEQLEIEWYERHLDRCHKAWLKQEQRIEEREALDQ